MRRLMTSLVVSLLCAVSSAQAQQMTPEAAKQRLEQLQQELDQRQQQLAQKQASAEELQSILARSEREIGQVAGQLNQTQQALSDNRQRQRALQTRQAELRDQIAQQQDKLAAQLKSAFVAGHYDYAKMIFNQDEAKSFERVLTYYKYFNKARQEQIDQFRAVAEELTNVSRELATTEAKLTLLVEQQSQQQAELTARQADREQTLAQLTQQIADEASQLERLQANERALQKAIEDAARAAQETLSLNGLEALRGKLEVPAKGRLRQLFGKRRQGQVRWKGVVIEGDEGSSVTSVAPGKILYADWLRGFGLVIIVDHGKGYMSVYGHNQALLKQAGDQVTGGETIALLGRSGGQAYPNLYFEIRLKGKALNPQSWLRK